MSQPYVGEIRMVGFNFAPVGWALCDGSLLPISENEVLFQLIGTTFGGDGQTTFALPDLRSRVPMHMGGGHVLGENGGQEIVPLATQQIPVHTHAANADNNASTLVSPAGGVWAASSNYDQFAPPAGANVIMNPQAVASDGGNQPHDNMLPYLTINFIISQFGIFPSPT
jgi:microcystin-dependent protein